MQVPADGHFNREVFPLRCDVRRSPAAQSLDGQRRRQTRCRKKNPAASDDPPWPTDATRLCTADIDCRNCRPLLAVACANCLGLHYGVTALGLVGRTGLLRGARLVIPLRDLSFRLF